jgi:hypothetical protein
MRGRSAVRTILALLFVATVTFPCAVTFAQRSSPAVSAGPRFEVLAFAGGGPVGFRFENYAAPAFLESIRSKPLEAALQDQVLGFDGYCFGFCQAACDAYDLGFDSWGTPIPASRAWIEKRQYEILNIVSDIIHNAALVGADEYTPENYRFLLESLQKGMLFPVGLCGGGRGKHAVVPYAVLKELPDGRLHVLVYDPNTSVQENGGHYSFLVTPDSPLLNFSEAQKALKPGTRISGYESPRILLDPGGAKFAGYSADTSIDRFFAVKKYVPKEPGNSTLWRRQGPGGGGKTGESQNAPAAGANGRAVMHAAEPVAAAAIHGRVWVEDIPSPEVIVRAYTASYSRPIAETKSTISKGPDSGWYQLTSLPVGEPLEIIAFHEALPGYVAHERITLSKGEYRYVPLSIGLTVPFTAGDPGMSATGSWLDILLLAGHFAEMLNQARRLAQLRPGRELSLCFVLDTSGSMGDNGKLEQTKKAVRVLLEFLDDGDRISSVHFSNDAGVVQEMVALGPEQRRRFVARIQELAPERQTNIGAGLAMASGELAKVEQAGSRIVILLSDGMNNVGDLGEGLRVFLSGPAGKCPIYTIALEGEADEATLRRISELSGGKYVETGVEGLKRLFSELVGFARGETSLVSYKDLIHQGETKKVGFDVAEGVRSMRATASWSGSRIDLRLVSPAGRVAADSRTGDFEYREDLSVLDRVIEVPEPGTWEAQLSGTTIPQEGEEVNFTVFSVEPVACDLWLGSESALLGQEVPVELQLQAAAGVSIPEGEVTCRCVVQEPKGLGVPFTVNRVQGNRFQGLTAPLNFLGYSRVLCNVGWPGFEGMREQRWLARSLRVGSLEEIRSGPAFWLNRLLETRRERRALYDGSPPMQEKWCEWMAADRAYALYRILNAVSPALTGKGGSVEPGTLQPFLRIDGLENIEFSAPCSAGVLLSPLAEDRIGVCIPGEVPGSTLRATLAPPQTAVILTAKRLIGVDRTEGAKDKADQLVTLDGLGAAHRTVAQCAYELIKANDLDRVDRLIETAKKELGLFYLMILGPDEKVKWGAGPPEMSYALVPARLSMEPRRTRFGSVPVYEFVTPLPQNKGFLCSGITDSRFREWYQ